jgi:hypothetical protein
MGRLVERLRWLASKPLLFGHWIVEKIDDSRIKACPVTRALIRLISSATFVYAMAIMVGGEKRWSQVTYSVLNQFPGSPYSWASILMTTTVMVMAGSLLASHDHSWGQWLKDAGFFLGCLWWITFGLCVASAVTPTNSVPFSTAVFPLLPIVVYVCLGMVDERNSFDDEEIFARPYHSHPA